MSNWDEENEVMQIVFEKDINLYDIEEAGKTCQKLILNGEEISVNEFKNSRKKGEQLNNFAKRVKGGKFPFYKGYNYGF